MRTADIEILREYEKDDRTLYTVRTSCPVNTGVDFIFIVQEFNGEYMTAGINNIKHEGSVEFVVQWYRTNRFFLRRSVEEEIKDVS